MHAFSAQSTPEDAEGLLSRAVLLDELRQYRLRMDEAGARAAEAC